MDDTDWDVSGKFERLGYLFYTVSPNRTSFKTIEETPDYSVLVVPYFTLMLFLEAAYLKSQKRTPFRINDAVTSIMLGMMQEMSRIFFTGWKLAAYIYIYNNWRLFDLPYNSLWLWWAGFLAVDFFYYWGHRACHEVNFLWAAHQVHHSSEDYNVTSALRLSVFQSYLLMVVNLPMALIVPPSGFLVHSHLNLIFQFWLHTEVVKTLGPLEYILNTPSHHRVHHGRNRYCIDKNYGATLIIWDRMFGTFEPEKKDEIIAYGLTHPINSFEPFYIQMHHYMHIWKTFWSIEGWKNKLSVIVKGPGWSPGQPWHGNPEDIPDVKGPLEKYDPPLRMWLKLYVLAHFIPLILNYLELMVLDDSASRVLLYGITIYELYAVSVLGMMLEGRSYTPWLELVRCVLFFVADYFFTPYTRLKYLHTFLQHAFIIALRSFYALSALFWLKHCVAKVRITLHSKPIRLFRKKIL